MSHGATSGIKRRNESSLEGERETKRVQATQNVPMPHKNNHGLSTRSTVGFRRLNEYYHQVQKLWIPPRNLANLGSEQLTALIALCRIFSNLLGSGKLQNRLRLTKSDLLIFKWLKKRLEELYALLLRLISSAQGLGCTLALDLTMQLVRSDIDSRSSSNASPWNVGVFPSLLRVLLHTDMGRGVVEHFAKGFFLPYADITHNTLRSMKSLYDSESQGLPIHNMLSLLQLLDFRRGEEAVSRTFFCRKAASFDRNTLIKKCQGIAEEGWMSILKRPLTGAQQQQVLDFTSNHLTYWFSRPEILMDFLTTSFDAGGLASLTALPGIYSLMREKNLDYPQLYAKLYSLLDRDYLHSRYQMQLLKLLDTFLSSTHLPAILVASFIKRLARLCLHASPSGLIAIIPWIYNLLRAHPACTPMIQRSAGAALRDGKQLIQIDIFLAQEPDPMETNAIESSLWEIETLQSHFHPNVSVIAKIISDQFTKQAYKLEDFLGHDSATMLDAELSKLLKNPPVVEYEIPAKIFMLNSEMRENDTLGIWAYSSARE